MKVEAGESGRSHGLRRPRFFPIVNDPGVDASEKSEKRPNCRIAYGCGIRFRQWSGERAGRPRPYGRGGVSPPFRRNQKRYPLPTDRGRGAAGPSPGRATPRGTASAVAAWQAADKTVRAAASRRRPPEGEKDFPEEVWARLAPRRAPAAALPPAAARRRPAARAAPGRTRPLQLASSRPFPPRHGPAHVPRDAEDERQVAEQVLGLGTAGRGAAAGDGTPGAGGGRTTFNPYRRPDGLISRHERSPFRWDPCGERKGVWQVPCRFAAAAGDFARSP